MKNFKRDASLNALFQLPQSNTPLHLKFTLLQNDAGQANEVGIFAVDDDRGTINGIAPGSSDYAQAALQRSQVIFSAAPQARFNNIAIQRHLSFDPETRLNLYLISNSTKQVALQRFALGQAPPPIRFAHLAANPDGRDFGRLLEVTNERLRLAWDDNPDGGDRDFNDVVLQAEVTLTAPPVGTGLQGQQELLDLRDYQGPIEFQMALNGNASYRNSFGLYVIDDEQGRVGGLRPGDAGYAQAALLNRVDLSQPLMGGQLLAPFFIAQGTAEQFLRQNPSNSVQADILAYFPFLRANPDGLDHILLLGDNTFAFEDLLGGGDLDFNDLVVQLRLPPAPTAPPPISNTPPVLRDRAKTGQVNQAIAFAASDFTQAFEDVDGDPLAELEIVSLPQDGLLSFQGQPVTPQQRFDVDDLDELVFSPDQGWTGITDFTWQASDGTAFASEPARMSLAVAAPPPQHRYNFNAPQYSTPEGNSIQLNNLVIVTRTGPLDVSSTVEVVLSSGTATVGSDVVAGPIRVEFALGEASKTVPLEILGDRQVEPAETFTLSFAQHAGTTQPTTTFTIENDDQPIAATPTYDFSSARFSTPEGDVTNTTNVVTVLRSGDLSQASSVDIVLQPGNSNPATAGQDFTVGPVTVNFAPGETSQVVAIERRGDRLPEPNETIALSFAQHAGTTQPTATLTLANDDVLTVYDFASARFSNPEGDNTNVTTVVTVLRSGDISAASTVDVVLSGGNPNPATAGQDFTAGPVTVNFAPGEASQTVAIEILGDRLPETSETIALTLANFSVGTQAGTTQPTATLTVVNEDAPPLYDFEQASYTVAEGDVASTVTVVTVVRSQNTDITSTVDVNLTSTGTNGAAIGTDIIAGPITLTFNPGETRQTVPLALLGETLFETDETVELSLSNFSQGGGPGLTQPRSTVTITNDDAPPTYDFTAASYNVTEGDATNTVTAVELSRSGDTSIASSVDVVLNAGSTDPATPGDDVTAGPITVNFAPGETSKTVPIEVLGDADFEADETLDLILAAFTNGSVAGATQPTASLAIANDDVRPVPIYDFTAATYATPEGRFSSTLRMVEVERSGDTSITSSVDVVLSPGATDPATPGTDFTTSRVTLTFAPGETSKTVSILVRGDRTYERDETIDLSLDNFTAGGVAGNTSPSAVLTLENDDAAPTLSIDDISVQQPTSGTANAEFTVELSAASGLPVTVDFSTQDDTATAPDDYVAQSGTLTFAPGETSKTITVQVQSPPPPPTPQPGTIQGVIWRDIIQNGVQDAGEPGISNQTVFLDTNQNGRLDSGEVRTQTNSRGEYTFGPLNPGTYTVAQLLKSGQTQVTPSTSPNSSSTLLSHPAAHDPIYDPVRNRLYLTTNFGKVERYDITTQQWLTPFEIGNNLNHGDITPDGKYLYVAENQTSNNQGFVYKVDLDTGAQTTLTYDLDFGEGGAWDVVIDSQGKGFVTTRYNGSGWTPLRELDTVNDTLTIRRDAPGSGFGGEVRGASKLLRSNDRNTVLFGEVNSSRGRAFTYDALADGGGTFNLALSGIAGATLVDSLGVGTIISDSFPALRDTSNFLSNAVMSVSHDGELIAIEEWFGKVNIFDRDFDPVTTLTGFNGGLGFDIKRDILYVADENTDEIVAYETNGWTERYRVPIGENISFSFGSSGTMTMSQDGDLLFFKTDSGTRMIDLPDLGNHSVTVDSGQAVTDINFGVIV
ncbi:MAG: DUF4114 domain-containing protein [Spirulina sp. SIO3F2]|nr:DUF4114 domain-containing protein [Spirulina sp. SIO3F2]